MKIKKLENVTTKQITDGLKLSGYRVFKIYNGGVPATVKSGKIIYKKKPKESKGVSDLLAINKRKKKMLFIEVKGSNNKPSKEQIEFLKLVNSVESIHGITAYDFKDLEEII